MGGAAPLSVVTERYGDDPSHVGDLYLPDGRPAGVAVVIHGGFWRDRYDRSLMADVCGDLAARGLAAWNLEYRRIGSGGGWPWTFDDVAAGVDHLSELGLLDAPVVTIGHSAGGHLALWAAARADPRVRVSHAVAQAGVVDLHEAARLELSGNAAAELLGGLPDEVPERYARASPAALVPLGVPQLLVHGGRDDIVPASMSRSYHERALAAGDEAVLVVDPKLGHFEHLDPGSRAWRAVTGWLDRIL